MTMQEPPASTARWTVEEHGWKQLLPELPEEVAALLASPVVVSAEAISACEIDPTAPAPARVPPGDLAPRFLAPSVPDDPQTPAAPARYRRGRVS